MPGVDAPWGPTVCGEHQDIAGQRWLSDKNDVQTKLQTRS